MRGAASDLKWWVVTGLVLGLAGGCTATPIPLPLAEGGGPPTRDAGGLWFDGAESNAPDEGVGYDLDVPYVQEDGSAPDGLPSGIDACAECPVGDAATGDLSGEDGEVPGDAEIGGEGSVAFEGGAGDAAPSDLSMDPD